MPILGWLIIIIVILMLVYGFWFQDSDSASENFTISCIDESNGTFDAPAAAALQHINNRPKPTPKERVARADIIRYNLHDDTVNDEAIARALADDYAAGIDGANTADDAEIATARLRTLATQGAAADVLLADTARIAAAATVAVNATRKAQSRATHRTRGDIARSYLRSSAVIADDRQNVHDSVANSDMRDTLRRIGAGNIGASRAIAEARDLINDPAWQRENPDIDVAAAERALQMIAGGRPIGTFSTTEDRIFASVWSRASHPDNMLAEGDIKTSIAHSLADMNEGLGLVCINGRCARLIGSLAAIDRDPTIGAIGTFDTYKAKIIAESGRIMEEKLTKMRETQPAEVAKWEAGDDSPVSKELADAIGEHVNTYRGRIPEAQLDAIRDTCTMSVV